MFTFKMMEPRKSSCQTSQMLALAEQQKREAYQSMQHAIKRNLVFRAHDRTSQHVRAASHKADQALNHLEQEIKDCHQSQVNFYGAKRRINQAALSNARDHKIDLELVDDSDDEQFERFSHQMMS